MKLVVYRLWQMLLGWGFVGVIYHGSDRWQGAGHLLTPGWVDRRSRSARTPSGCICRFS